MSTALTPNQMKQSVRAHCEQFVNQRNLDVIRKIMTTGLP